MYLLSDGLASRMCKEVGPERTDSKESHRNWRRRWKSTGGGSQSSKLLPTGRERAGGGAREDARLPKSVSPFGAAARRHDTTRRWWQRKAVAELQPHRLRYHTAQKHTAALQIPIFTAPEMDSFLRTLIFKSFSPQKDGRSHWKLGPMFFT